MSSYVALKRHTATTSTWAAGRKVAPSTSSKHNDVFILTIKNKKQRLPLTNTAQTDLGLLSGWTQLLGSTELLLATVRYQTCPCYGDRGQWSNTLVGMWRTPLEKWNIRIWHFCYSIMSRVATIGPVLTTARAKSVTDCILYYTGQRNPHCLEALIEARSWHILPQCTYIVSQHTLKINTLSAKNYTANFPGCNKCVQSAGDCAEKWP